MKMQEVSIGTETLTRTPSMAVVVAVAETRGVDPLELEPLANVIDPEALDRLFTEARDDRPRMAGSLTFEMAGCEVTVTSAGEVSVTSKVAEDGVGTAAEG